MARFPRLDLLFGRAVEDWTETELTAAVAASTREDSDLDWKQQPYAKYDGVTDEIGKDVAAIVNAGGGVLVFGVRDSDNRAAELTPFDLKLAAGAEARIQGAVAEKVAPVPLGMAFRLIPSSTDGLGYLIAMIPDSADAPHAVRNPDRRSLAYPVRDGDKTRWLAESEVASRYRDRFSRRNGRIERLEEIHAEAMRDVVTSNRLLLSLTLVPELPGRAPVGRTGIEEVRAWCGDENRFPSPLILEYQNVRLGLRKVISSALLTELGEADHTHVEFHEDGSGFAAADLSGGLRPGQPAIRGVPGNTASARISHIEATVIAALQLLTDHATQRARCTGDAAVRLDLTPGPSWILTISEPTLIGGEERRAPGARLLREPWPEVHAAVSLDVISSSRVELLIAARLLCSDLLSVFGTGPEPLAVAADGTLSPARFGQESRQVAAWAVAAGLPGFGET